ncbi:GSCOCG00007994001-RA-CDS [Cotesia congregata]|nr:GSCOCG00007994001-RA-CDS [Cotesia congregata]
MRDRIYLMNTVVGAAALYGVEVWGWGGVKDIERVQGRFCKMALGVNRNTPGYIWRTEAGVQNIKATTRERAARYVKDVLAMEEDRWPKIALREEMRGILNRNPAKWGRKLHAAIKEMGCEEIAGMIYNKEEKEKIDEKINAGVERYKEKLKEDDEKAIERSSYNKMYKKIMIEKDGYNYWKDDKKRGEDKEQWARIRCGNIGRAYKKGYTEWTCRLCEENIFP